MELRNRVHQTRQQVEINTQVQKEMRQTRNVFVQDRNLASRIQERSAQNEEDIVYLSRELANVNFRVNRSASDNEQIETNSRRIDSLNSQQRELNKQVGSTRDKLRELINQLQQNGSVKSYAKRCQIRRFFVTKSNQTGTF